MISAFRKQFNDNYSPEKYKRFLAMLDDACFTHIQFRPCETPVFLPSTLVKTLEQSSVEIVEQLIHNKEYHRISAAAIPDKYNVPNETAHPLFIQIDFGLVDDGTGTIAPKLIELQAFASMYMYQVAMVETYKRAYELDARFSPFFGALHKDEYLAIMRKAFLGEHSAENVILMEIEPYKQKTLPDFLLTQKYFGITPVDISSLKKSGKKLFYERDGKWTPIHRIYNRTIADELERKNITPPFDFRDELEVEWADHPNWFFRLSKFSIPYLHHPSVPKSIFLNEVAALPDDLHNYVLKPLFSFAGAGVIVEPTREDVLRVPENEKANFILQEKVLYKPVVETPFGGTKAEVRCMFVWQEKLQPVLFLIRMGRGRQMGVDFNKNMEWVGSSAGLYLDE
jgi:hypothetical protein